MKVYLNGKFFDDSASVSVLDHGFLYGNGVFETLRTYSNKAFKVEEHMARLFNSALIIQLDVNHTKIELINAINTLVDSNKGSNQELRIRATITAGAGPIKLSSSSKSTICIISEPLSSLNPDFYDKGIFVVSYDIERIFPEAKSCNMLPNIIAKKFADQKKANEAIMIDNLGFAREGTISNIFIVSGNKIITPKHNILKGITRDTIIELASEFFEVVEKDITLKDIYKSNEVFLTNTTSEVLPVTKINHVIIGNGKPGPITKNLMETFKLHVKKAH